MLFFSAVCDPVMGDEGKLYVAPELVKAYRERIMPLANVLVPNQVCFCKKKVLLDIDKRIKTRACGNSLLVCAFQERSCAAGSHA